MRKATKTPAKKPRNYKATESTLGQLQKTRRDITRMQVWLDALEQRIKRLERQADDATTIPDEPAVETVPGEPWR